jgi:hypothetical protein
MQAKERSSCPSSFHCVPVDPPEPGTPILFFTPSIGGFGEPHKWGAGRRRCKECDIIQPHTHEGDPLVKSASSDNAAVRGIDIV